MPEDTPNKGSSDPPPGSGSGVTSSETTTDTEAYSDPALLESSVTSTTDTTPTSGDSTSDPPPGSGSGNS